MLKFISNILPQEGIFGLHNDSAASAIVISALVVFTYAATYSIAALLRRFSANIQLKNSRARPKSSQTTECLKNYPR